MTTGGDKPRAQRKWVEQAKGMARSAVRPVPGSVEALATAPAPAASGHAEPLVDDQTKLANAQSNNALPTVTESANRTRLSPFKWGFFGGIGAVVAFMLYGVVTSLQSTLIVLAIAALLAIGLNPAVSALIKRGFRRGFAVLVVMLGLLAFIGGTLYAVIPPIVEQVGALVTDLPDRLSALLQNSTIKSLDERFHIIDQLQQGLAGAATTVVSASVTIATVIVDLLVIMILTLYFLAAFPKIKHAAYQLAPASKRKRVTELGDVIVAQMGGYLAGATLIALQAGVVAGLFAQFAGLPYPWAIALAAALLDFVPVVGPIIVGLSMMLLGFTVSVTVGIIAAVFYLCQHLFEAYWLYPKVMNRSVHISSASVIVAILVGGALLGVTGALMAVPVAAALQLIVREVVFPLQNEA